MQQNIEIIPAIHSKITINELSVHFRYDFKLDMFLQHTI